MNWDDLLGRIKVNRKPLSKERLTWWLVIILTKLFGRRVAINDADGRSLRVFPIVWGGKVRLLGLEHDEVFVDFSNQYTLRINRSPSPAITEGKALPILPFNENYSAAHIVTGHMSAEVMDAILQHAHRLGSRYHHLHPYGGPRENYDAIQWPHKVFVADPLLRGLTYKLSYVGLVKAAQALMREMQIDPTWIFISDYDIMPTVPNYLDGAVRMMMAHGAGFAGKNLRELSLSNSPFVANAIAEARMTPDLNRAGQQPLYQCLGAALLFHKDCFHALFSGDEKLSSTFFELAIPTLASKRGFRLMNFNGNIPDFDHVRYRPVYSPEEAVALAAQGAKFVHPVKDIMGYLRLVNDGAAKAVPPKS